MSQRLPIIDNVRRISRAFLIFWSPVLRAFWKFLTARRLKL